MDSKIYIKHIKEELDKSVVLSKGNQDGRIADYIPELKSVDPELLSAGICLTDGTFITSGPSVDYKFTLQSVSKCILLVGLLEEYGAARVFSWINTEPSGQPFAAIGHLDRYGPVPSNPLINAGAICLSGRIPGDTGEQLNWVKNWVTKCFGEELTFSESTYKSEFLSADRNRSLAYLMKSTGVLKREVEETLVPYFSLCSYEADIAQASYFPLLLANGGVCPDGSRVFSEDTAKHVVSIMTTCGLYNESGTHLVWTGLPAKSAVSGLVIAVATGRAGIATFSPRLNSKSTSVRGAIILNEIANSLGWHFASPWGYTKLNGSSHREH